MIKISDFLFDLIVDNEYPEINTDVDRIVKPCSKTVTKYCLINDNCKGS